MLYIYIYVYDLYIYTRRVYIYIVIESERAIISCTEYATVEQWNQDDHKSLQTYKTTQFCGPKWHLPRPSINPLGSSNPQDFRRFSDDRLQGTSFFGNNRNHWKVRNQTNFPPKGSYMLQLAKMNPMFLLYCNLALEIFRSPRFNDFSGKGEATSKCQWCIQKLISSNHHSGQENYPFWGGVNGRKQSQQQKKIHQKMATLKKVFGVGNPTTLPLLFS